MFFTYKAIVGLLNSIDKLSESKFQQLKNDAS